MITNTLTDTELSTDELYNEYMAQEYYARRIKELDMKADDILANDEKELDKPLESLESLGVESIDINAYLNEMEAEDRKALENN